MKQIPYGLLKALSALALIGAATSSAFANSVTLDTNAYSDVYGGGEFTALGSGLSTASYSSAALLGGGFETFCMSFREEFVPGNWGNPTPYNFTLGNAIIDPSFNPVNNPLTIGTAYLYSQFASGDLTGYDYSNSTAAGRLGSATELQLAFWWLQNEGSEGAPGASNYDPTNPFEAMVYNLFNGATGGEMNAANGADGVQVMVLTTSNGGYAQPQLYYSVPDAETTGVLVLASLIALGAFAYGFRNLRVRASE